MRLPRSFPASLSVAVQLGATMSFSRAYQPSASSALRSTTTTSSPRLAVGGHSRMQRMMRAGAVLAVIGLLTLPLFACGSKEAAAAKVNGEDITVAALDSEMAKLRLQNPTLFDPNSGMSEDLIRSEMLSELINQRLFAQEAASRGVEVTEADLDAEMNQYFEANGGQEMFEAILEQSGLTLESARELIRWEELRNRVLEQEVPESEVSDDEIAAYYAANTAEFQFEAAKRTSHILFNVEDEALANEVLGRVRGGEDFAELATEYSQDKGSAISGGDLGWPTVDYVPEFEAAIETLAVGEISDLVKTEFGWHIITVTEDRAAGTESLEDATEYIRESLLSSKRQAAYNDLLGRLRSEGDIEILDPRVLAATAAAAAPAAGAETPATTATDGQ